MSRVEAETLGSRLGRLSATRSGRLPGLNFHDDAARAAILIDLVFRQRVSWTSTGVWLAATAPTGTAPFDAMLTYIERHPGIATDRILAKAPGRMAAFLPAPASGRRWWLRRRKFTRDEVGAERQRLEQAIDAGIDTPDTAALALLADALRLVVLPDREGVFSACGENAWIVQACVQFLLLARDRYEFASAAAGAGGGGS
jgi:hypothetical protein